MLDGLIVDEARMRRNLDVSDGLIVAEAVMMGLAPHIGRQQAHDVVYAACREAVDTGRNLADVLIASPEVAEPPVGRSHPLADGPGELPRIGGGDGRPAARRAGRGIAVTAHADTDNTISCAISLHATA